MVETIAPVVHGNNRSRYFSSVALHALGATLTAAAVGGLLGAAGLVLGAPWGIAGAIAIAIVALVYGLREAFRLPVPLPDRQAQVPEWWRTFYSPQVTAFLYGAGLGIGFLTYLSFGTYVAVSAAALASGSPLVGALLCAPFGLARGLSVVIAARAGPESDGSIVVGRLDELGASSVPRLVNAAALSPVVVTALASL